MAYRKHILPAAIIVLSVFAVFYPTLRNGFVWDDRGNFIYNFSWRGLGLRELSWMFSTPHYGHYMPLSWLTLGFDYILWGLNPKGHHLTNIIIHAINAVLVYFLTLRLLQLARKKEMAGPGIIVGSLFAALFFGIHPLRVESVAWVTERRDVLSGFFYFLTLIAYLRYNTANSRKLKWYIASVVFFLFSLLSKAFPVSLPLVLLILDFYPLERLKFRTLLEKNSLKIYAEKFPFAFLSGIFSAVALLITFQIPLWTPLAKINLIERLLLTVNSLGFHIQKTFWPFNLAPLYSIETALANLYAPGFILRYMAVFGAFLVFITYRKSAPYFLAFFLAYTATLIPVSGIFHAGPQYAADRYTYLSCIGLAIIAGGFFSALYEICSQKKPHRFLAGLLMAAAVLALFYFGTLTWHQTFLWREDSTLPQPQ